MKKRALSLLLVLVMVFGLLPVTAQANTLDNGLKYTVYGNRVTITGYNGDATQLVIPSRINGLPVSSIGDGAFGYCDSLTSIVLPDSLIYIGRIAFEGCSSLTSIDIPKSVTSIGLCAFDGCSSLTGIHVDKNNPNYCSDNRGVLFDKAKTELIQAPGAITGSYTVPESVTSIGYHAFYYRKSLTSIDLPDSLTSIGFAAFYSCSSLTSIHLPASITTIDSNAFAGCARLTGIHVDKNNPNYCSDNRGVLFDKTKTQLIQAPGAIAGSYAVPASVTSIGSDAFQGCSSLTSIDLPDNLTSINSSAFLGCSSLTSIDLPATLTSIAFSVFHGCSSLTSIDLPDNLTSIDFAAFYGCTNLNNIDLPDNLTSIGHSAFKGCSSLTSIVLPDSLTSIADSTFSGCSSLASIDISNSVTTIGGTAFAGCSSLTSIDLPDSLTSIRNIAFQGCTSLTSIDIPDSVTSIGFAAFQDCSSLASIYFCGDAPSFGGGGLPTAVFIRITATAYYPATNPTWTEDVMQDYGGDITWIGYNPEGSFYDVQMGSWYEAPVEWAVENNITTGATTDTFNPNGECLRAQVVTFLHRAAENPEPTSTNNPFSDVKSSDFFYKPVLWAVEKGITNGTSADQFGSYATCNRAAVVTFLWRAAGSPEPESTDNPFVDVKSTDFFYKPILWAIENGITNGVDATHFGPTTPCNRAQVVTFLYRTYN